MAADNENYNASELCRLCGVTDNRKVNIFSSRSKIISSISLSEQIYECYSIKALADDSLPNKICTECRARLDYIYEVKLKSREANKLLEQCSSNKARPKRIEYPKFPKALSQRQNRKIECKYNCGKFFASTSGHKKHLKTHHLECCGKPHESSAYKKHRETVHRCKDCQRPLISEEEEKNHQCEQSNGRLLNDEPSLYVDSDRLTSASATVVQPIECSMITDETDIEIAGSFSSGKRSHTEDDDEFFTPPLDTTFSVVSDPINSYKQNSKVSKVGDNFLNQTTVFIPSSRNKKQTTNKQQSASNHDDGSHQKSDPIIIDSPSTVNIFININK